MLVNCKACNKEIGKGVKKCIHCGTDQRNFFGKHKIITVILALVIIGGIGSAMGDDTAAPTSSPANSTAATSSTKPTDSAIKPQETAKPQEPAKPTVKTYKAGMYKIGSDMPAGEYVLVGSGMSYFEIDKDSTGQMNSILANDNFSKRSIVSVQDGQYLKLTGCTAYAFNDAPKVQPKDGFMSEGMYKVGVDLPAGEYKVIPEGMPYVEVSKDSSHTMNSIVSNDLPQGESYISIKDGQYIKLTGAKLQIK